MENHPFLSARQTFFKGTQRRNTTHVHLRKFEREINPLSFFLSSFLPSFVDSNRIHPTRHRNLKKRSKAGEDFRPSITTTFDKVVEADSGGNERETSATLILQRRSGGRISVQEKICIERRIPPSSPTVGYLASLSPMLRFLHTFPPLRSDIFPRRL